MKIVSTFTNGVKFLQFFKGFKTTIFSLLMASICFSLLNYFPHIWTPWLSLIDMLLPITLVITAIFSAYFNHSRITLLTGVFLLLAVSEKFVLPWSQWFSQNETWIILNNLFLLIGLSFLKDRGLISIHGLHRVFFLAFIGLLAYAWLYFDTWVLSLAEEDKLGAFQFTAPWLHYLLTVMPCSITLLFLFYRSVTKASTFSAALLVTSLFFIGEHYYYINFSWQINYFVFALYYLLVVIVDSYFLAYRDDLTGLPSRRALNQLALSLGRKYTVAMLDIDHFKKFNDTYGHDIGDQVLKLVASKIGDVKGGGKAFRYGGEEFTVVFPRKDIKQVLEALETVRQTIADYAVTIRNPARSNRQDRKATVRAGTKQVRVTISIGVASREGKQLFSETLKVADQALYRAKNKGRNNVSE